MGILKGQLEYQKYKEGKSLTRKEAILAMCYECNGMEESGEDCMKDCDGENNCPLYQYHPHRSRKKRVMTLAQLEALKKMRETRQK